MSSEKRPVAVVRCVRRIVDGKSEGVQVHDYHGVFLGWGMDWEEVGSGPANYTAAIIEKDNGEVALVPPTLIRFLDGVATEAAAVLT